MIHASASSTRDSISDIWGPRTPPVGNEWPVRVDQHTTEAPDRWVQSACVLCSNGCGMDIGVKDDTPGGRIVGVRGRAVDVVNRGRLGPKGLHGWVANNSPDRLTHPLIRRGGKLVQASWDEAMDLVVRQMRETKERYTAGAIGFYTSGQLFLEEYYTLGVIGKAGVRTMHMDGSTRLCTATAGVALKETFGADGQPGAYSDIDVTDCFLHIGHNMAATDTVLWARVLDRRRAAMASRMVAIDPRLTPVAAEADLHIQPRLGTNVAVLNGILQQLIAQGYADHAFLEAHTVGFQDLAKTVARYAPDRVAEIAHVPAGQIVQAAQIIGSSRMLLSTCLQGIYQSNQGTAAGVQVNNVNLVLGRIGRPGCGILQMNGQPTAQNTRECGAGGDLPAFRNWDNPTHLEQLAELWNVDPKSIPNWGPPTHILQMFNFIESGSIRLLWVQATNPAVSMPNLGRLRAALQKDSLFLIVQDAFLTETAAMADVVLPAAMWGEKTGCFTNVGRTVHISHKAIEPPGEARSDLDILLDFARRMDFRDKDGASLIKWSNAEGAFEAWKAATAGRPCDYTGLSYAKLSQGSGIPWPCNSEHPDGSDRHYEDLHFPTDPEHCESFGHDLLTGAEYTEAQYRAKDPRGRAFLRAADYVPPTEEPDADYPFYLSTGRVVFQFHTRTKTARSPALNQAAPDAFIQVSVEDARQLGIAAGEMLRATSRRGAAEAPARIGDIGAGQAFMPFHYGYWDDPGRVRAANELTLFEWDPVSKQPHFKYAAVKLEKAAGLPPLPPPEVIVLRGAPTGAVQAAGAIEQPAKRAHLADCLGLLHAAEERMLKGWAKLRDTHGSTPDVGMQCLLFSSWAQTNIAALKPYVDQYGERIEGEPEVLDRALLIQRKPNAFGLLRDLQDLWLMANESMVSIMTLMQGALALDDYAFEAVLKDIETRSSRQRDWLLTRIRQAAPQTLTVPS